MYSKVPDIEAGEVSRAISGGSEGGYGVRVLSPEEVGYVSGASRLRDNISSGAFIVGSGGGVGGIGVGLGFAGRTASFGRLVLTGARFGAAGGLAGVALGAVGGAAFFAAQEYLF